MFSSVQDSTIISLAQAVEKHLPKFEKEYFDYVRNAKRTGLWPFKPDRIIFIEKMLVSADLIKVLAAQAPVLQEVQVA